jgi:hypothetical protein
MILIVSNQFWSDAFDGLKTEEEKNSCRLVEKSHFDALRFQGYRTFTSYPDGLQMRILPVMIQLAQTAHVQVRLASILLVNDVCQIDKANSCIRSAG